MIDHKEYFTSNIEKINAILLELRDTVDGETISINELSTLMTLFRDSAEDVYLSAKHFRASLTRKSTR
jgi:hypothetical protein